MPNSSRAISSIIANLLDDMEDKESEELSVGDILDTFGSRTYGPVLFTIGFIVFSPIGAIPGVAILGGLLTMAISLQYFFSNSHIWVPKRIKQINMSAQKAEVRIRAIRPKAVAVEKYIRPRMYILIKRPGNYLIMAIILLMGITMIPLEIVPWADSLPALCIMMLSISLVSRDGLIASLGMLCSIATATFAYHLITQSIEKVSG